MVVTDPTSSIADTDSNPTNSLDSSNTLNLPDSPNPPSSESAIANTPAPTAPSSLHSQQPNFIIGAIVAILVILMAGLLYYFLFFTNHSSPVLRQSSTEVAFSSLSSSTSSNAATSQANLLAANDYQWQLIKSYQHSSHGNYQLLFGRKGEKEVAIKLTKNDGGPNVESICFLPLATSDFQQQPVSSSLISAVTGSPLFYFATRQEHTNGFDYSLYTIDNQCQLIQQKQLKSLNVPTLKYEMIGNQLIDDDAIAVHYGDSGYGCMMNDLSGPCEEDNYRAWVIDKYSFQSNRFPSAVRPMSGCFWDKIEEKQLNSDGIETVTFYKQIPHAYFDGNCPSQIRIETVFLPVSVDSAESVAAQKAYSEPIPSLDGNMTTLPNRNCVINFNHLLAWEFPSNSSKSILIAADQISSLDSLKDEVTLKLYQADCQLNNSQDLPPHATQEGAHFYNLISTADDGIYYVSNVTMNSKQNGFYSCKLNPNTYQCEPTPTATIDKIKDYFLSSRAIEAEADFMPPMTGKPVIYLYPPTIQGVKVQLDYQGKLIADYPTYDSKINGWQVVAHPGGKIVDPRDQQEYSYIFWEGIPHQSQVYDWSQGFVIPGSQTKQFLQSILSQIGLTPQEYNEFIVYWYPKMMSNPYNLIHFATDQEYAQTLAPLTVTPTPDQILRVFMVYQSLKQLPAQLPQAQVFPTFNRTTGFTVVEWGGAEEQTAQK